jgi:hypothetical protein
MRRSPSPARRTSPSSTSLFDTPEYTYRVFVTNMDGPLDTLVGFYRGRASAENLIKEANNDAGLAAHPSNRWTMQMRHTTLATARLRFLFLAAKIWRHAGRAGVSYSDHYEEKGLFDRLMGRLRAIAARTDGFAPVIATALRC